MIAVTAHSPFGEAERAVGRWLPYLRPFTAAALTGLAILDLQLGAVGESLNDQATAVLVEGRQAPVTIRPCILPSSAV